MRTRFFCLMAVVMLLAACNAETSTGASYADEIAALEARVAKLEAQADVAQKSMNVKSDLINTAGVLEFFKMETNVMDVGLAGCSSDCGKANILRRLACAEAPETEGCSAAELARKADSCQAECVKHFERPIVE